MRPLIPAIAASLVFASITLTAAAGAIRCATFSAGATQSSSGLIVTIGVPSVGQAAGCGIALQAGALPCLGFPTVTPSPADLDGNGTVDFPDLLLVLGSWGSCPAPPESCSGDVDCDGTVGFEDLLDVLANWD